MQEQQETRREEQPQGGQAQCPVCGQPMWAPRGPWARRMGPRGMGYMGPWGGYAHHPGHWVHGPMGMVWTGIVPALVGFALGYVLATARLSALCAFASEKRRR